MVFKYKKINQNYLDPWKNGKSKIKIMNSIFILNVIYSLIEKKKNLLLLKVKYFINWLDMFRILKL